MTVGTDNGRDYRHLFQSLMFLSLLLHKQLGIVYQLRTVAVGDGVGLVDAGNIIFIAPTNQQVVVLLSHTRGKLGGICLLLTAARQQQDKHRQQDYSNEAMTPAAMLMGGTGKLHQHTISVG